MFKVPEKFRVKDTLNPNYRSTKADGNNGVFRVKTRRLKSVLHVIASDGCDWEHVSVSVHNRCPNWAEMSFIKDLFWDSDDCVVQFHPPKSQYVNHHPYCLHLWRKIGGEFEIPPSLLVGPKLNGND